MRVLLDENLPVDFAAAILGHDVETVVGLGWSGVSNGELLVRAATERFDALVTMDRNLNYQQPIERQPFGAILIRAKSNWIRDLTPLIPDLHDALVGLQVGDLRVVGA